MSLTLQLAAESLASASDTSIGARSGKLGYRRRGGSQETSLADFHLRRPE
jgi:hypothetical protein